MYRLSFLTQRVREFDVRYAIWGVGLLLVATLPAFAGFVGFGWEFSQLAGLAGILGCVVLSGSPVRPRDSMPPALLSIRLHTLIGWATVLAVAIHVVGLVLADRTVVEYLKPTAPLYQVAGIAASLLLVIVVVSSTAAVRRHLWSSHRGFQAMHVIFGCLLAVLAAAHVLATSRYAGGRGRRTLLVAVTIVALLMLLRRRRPGNMAHTSSKTQRRLVFGRHSGAVLCATLVATLALAALLRSSSAAVLRESLLRRASPIPLDFPHGKHTQVNCLQCHHNYADGRGFDRCVGCHSSGRSDLKEGIEARFHGFCFECHRNPPANFSHHGPVSGCASCHAPPGAAAAAHP